MASGQAESSRFKILAEVASALAVVVSLVFVGLEVRETARQTELNTSSLQIAAYQDLIGQIADWNHRLTEPEFASLWIQISRSGATWDELSETDRVRALGMMFLLLRHGDMAYYQFERGMLSETRLRSALRPLTIMRNSPLALEFWEDNKGNFVPEYANYLDAYLAE